LKKTSLTLTILCLLVLSMLAACVPDGATLAGTRWKLVSYGLVSGQKAVVPGVETSLNFGSDGKVSGSLGCNSLGGDYTVKGATITFREIVSTVMACANPQVMEQEGVAFKVLQNTSSFALDGDTLTMLSEDKLNALRLVALK
jgi:heat shock protein HslJ